MPNLAVVSFSSKSTVITLTLQRPSGGIATYHVKCMSPNGTVVKDITQPATLEDQVVQVDSLTPYTEYSCEVTSYVSTKSNSLTLKIMTLQAGKLTK